MNNLELWDKVRAVPETAKKEIKGGRLKGKTDINPMWRLKELTEQFGICGIGWKYEIINKCLETGANGEISAFVDIELFVKDKNEWSYAIPGTGGSMFVAKETSGLYTSDECFKMALTDAISVSCKALGIGADVYWEKDKTKYDTSQATANNTASQQGNSSTQSVNAPKNAPAASGKATKGQVVELFKLSDDIKKDKPEHDLFKMLEELEKNSQISTRYPYADKTKTKVNWDLADYETIKLNLQLPF